MTTKILQNSEIYEPDYLKLQLIGRGAFGKVYKCHNPTKETIFAVKELEKTDFNLKSIIAELNIIKNISRNKRFVTFFGITDDCSYIKIFTEYMSKGSLRDVINKSGNLTEEKTKKYVRNIVEGIDYLHENNVIHRDIKCGNILLDDEDNVKLTDFGLSKIVEDNTVLQNQTNCGTTNFMAPELLLKKAYNYSVDIWALGVTIVEMRTGKPIYSDLKNGPFIIQVTKTRGIEFNIPETSNELLYFLKLTFVKEPTFRPDTKDLLRTRFLDMGISK